MKKGVLAALLMSTAITPIYGATITVDYNDGKPLVYIKGDIEQNDADTFKAKTQGLTQAMVVLDSPGGYMLSGLRMGEIIHDKGFWTLAPRYCASVCANMWVAGRRRYMSAGAKVGFHQPYDEKGKADVQSAAIVGSYLNRMGLTYKAVIWAMGAAPDDIVWLTPDSVKDIGLQVVVVDNDGNTVVDLYEPQTAFRTTPVPTAPPTPNPPYAPQPAPLPDPLRARAQQVVTYLITVTQNNAEMYRAWYADPVIYYGNPTSRDDVIKQIGAYFVRWPKRSYKITNIFTSCDSSLCVSSGAVDFVAESDTKRSTGSATFSYTLVPSGNSFYVRAESGQNITRQIVDLKQPMAKAIPHQMVR